MSATVTLPTRTSRAEVWASIGAAIAGGMPAPRDVAVHDMPSGLHVDIWLPTGGLDGAREWAAWLGLPEPRAATTTPGVSVARAESFGYDRPTWRGCARVTVWCAAETAES